MNIEHQVVPAIALDTPQRAKCVSDQITQLCAVLRLVERIAAIKSNRPPVDQAALVHEYCHACGIAQRRARTLIEQATAVAVAGVTALLNRDDRSPSIAAACLATELRSVLRILAATVGRQSAGSAEPGYGLALGASRSASGLPSGQFLM